MENSSKVYILIVNWNGWADTIECLESVFRNNYPNYQVIVCDNDSQNNSIEHIQAWADGALDVYVQSANPLRRLAFPPLPKAIEYVVYDRAQAESGGLQGANTPLVIVKTGANLGFSGGNNVGLRYALARNDCTHIWMLNNDTVIDSNALTALVQRMADRPDAGICGSTVLYYSAPDSIQTLGGSQYNRWLATARLIGNHQNKTVPIDTATVESKISFIVGASMFVSLELFKTVGLLNEEFFLYYEEIDLAVRAQNKFNLTYSQSSYVYHKGGASIGTGYSTNNRSALSDYYSIRNRILFTRCHYPLILPVVYIGLIGVIFNRITRRQWKMGFTVFGIMIRSLLLRVKWLN